MHCFIKSLELCSYWGLRIMPEQELVGPLVDDFLPEVEVRHPINLTEQRDVTLPQLED